MPYFNCDVELMLDSNVERTWTIKNCVCFSVGTRYWELLFNVQTDPKCNINFITKLLINRYIFFYTSNLVTTGVSYTHLNESICIITPPTIQITCKMSLKWRELSLSNEKSLRSLTGSYLASIFVYKDLIHWNNLLIYNIRNYIYRNTNFRHFIP